MFKDILYNLIWTLRKIPRKTYNKNAFKNTQGLRNPYSENKFIRNKLQLNEVKSFLVNVYFF